MPGTALGGAAVFVAALLIRAAYRAASSPARGPDSRRSLASAGTVLMLLGVAAGGTVAGSFFAERPPGAGVPLPEGYVLAAAVLLTGIGAGLRAGGTRARSVHIGARRGRAFIRSIRPTGRAIKGVPVWEIDMDVTAPGAAGFHTVHLEAIPPVMAETIEAGGTFPVLVEAGGLHRVALDWITAPPHAEDGFGEGSPRQRAIETAPERGAKPSRVDAGPPAAPEVVVAPRVVMVVVTVVLLAVAVNVVTRIFDSDAPPVVVPAGEHSATSLQPEIPPGRAGVVAGDDAPVGFTVAVPAGWRDDSDASGGRDGEATIDAMLRSVADPAVNLRVSRSVRFTNGPLPPGATLATVLPLVHRELGASVVRSEPAVVDLEPAMQMDVRPSEGARQRFVVLVREGELFFVTVGAPVDRWRDAAPVLDEVLASWRWS